MDIKKHFEELLELLKKEREEERKIYLKKILYTDIKSRVEQGITWYPIVITDQYIGSSEHQIMEIERTSALDTRHNFQGGTSISLFVNSTEKKKYSVSGVIGYLRGSKMKLVLNTTVAPEWINEGKLGINLMYDDSTYKEMEATLKTLKKMETGRSVELSQMIYGLVRPSFSKAHAISLPSLNNSQNAALQLIISALDIALVHGPPGTGKTTTLVQAIKYVAGIEKQVLVCAPSNTAVDLLAEKLLQQNLKVLRIGHPARISEEAIDSALDTQITNHPQYKEVRELRKKSEALKAMAYKYKRQFGSAERQQRKLLAQESKQLRNDAFLIESYIVQSLLDDAEVVVATLAGSNHKVLKGKFFKSLFIDEAGQALEPACWIPMLKANRVIMAGDHHQLPPTVRSKEAEQAGLGYTLFERIMEQHQANAMLRVQYRMEPAIMSYSNQYFYQGLLDTDRSVLDRAPLDLPKLEFIDTAGAGYDDRKDPETGSTYNPDEAGFAIQYLLKHLDQLSINGKIEHLKVGIIAPYRAQVEELSIHASSRIKDRQDLPKITINTVDGFQGQERDIVLISLTRSNSDGEIGFLKDLRRMNVAMTRAKYSLIMIGDSSTLGTHPFFNDMIAYFQECDAYRSVFEEIY